jgi:ATP sulfurylase
MSIKPKQNEKKDSLVVRGRVHEEVELPREMSRDEIAERIITNSDFREKIKNELGQKTFSRVIKEL